jgi:HK97 family phage major capsid protein
MKLKKSEKLVQEMKGKWDEIQGIRDLVVKEEREFSDEEKAKVETVLDEVREIEIQVKKERENESLIAQINEFSDLFTPDTTHKSGDDPQNNGGGDRLQRKQQMRSMGEQFVKSDMWQGWIKQFPGGRIPESKKGISSPPVEIKNLLRKTLLTGESDTSAGAFVQTDYTGIYEPLGRYQLSVLDMITTRQTGSDLVEFVRQTSQVTQAEPTAESNVTTYSGATGEVSGEKPEGAMTFLKVTESVKTIPVWIPATKRALSDVPQLRGIIDDELMADTREELANQVLNGDGVGENFTGLASTSGVLAQAFVTNIAVTARKAITNLLINGKQMPTGWLLNPQDWEAFDLLTDDNNRYYWGGPMAMGPRTLWGVPVAQSYLQTQGTGWLGNWAKAVLWNREQATISVSDSHEDFFIRNMVAILCELRAAFGIIRPSAFVEVDLESGS